jgi:hypothetical protein
MKMLRRSSTGSLRKGELPFFAGIVGSSAGRVGVVLVKPCLGRVRSRSTSFVVRRTGTRSSMKSLISYGSLPKPVWESVFRMASALLVDAMFVSQCATLRLPTIVAGLCLPESENTRRKNSGVINQL